VRTSQPAEPTWNAQAEFLLRAPAPAVPADATAAAD